MTLGPIICDIEGIALTQEEKERLSHPLVGGVILFTRNYQSPEQLSTLTQAIHSLRTPPLLICVDHEGGRIQRFQSGFTHLPAASTLGRIYQQDSKRALQAAEVSGWLMATELRALGVDLSFAPVLDLAQPNSIVMAKRTLSADPDTVSLLANHQIKGMQRGGMQAIGKHFPGHGSVVEDSHLTTPIDPRPLAQIEQHDLRPFQTLISLGLPAVMTAHIKFPRVDDTPVSYSSVWLKQILREKLKFQGIVFSDDINMAGANLLGNYIDRATKALTAGCDIVLVCNNKDATDEILDQLKKSVDTQLTQTMSFDKPPDFPSKKARQIAADWIEKNVHAQQYRHTRH